MECVAFKLIPIDTIFQLTRQRHQRVSAVIVQAYLCGILKRVRACTPVLQANTRRLMLRPMKCALMSLTGQDEQ